MSTGLLGFESVTERQGGVSGVHLPFPLVAAG